LTYEGWLQQFDRSRDGKKTLDSLHALGIDHDSKTLERLILSQCYWASQYDERTDRNAQARARDKAILTEIPAQIEAIQTLRAFIKKYPTAAAWAFTKAFLDLKDIQYHGVEPRGTHLILDDILGAFQKGLETPLPGIRAGPWVHRTQLGCLMYPNAIDLRSAKADAAVNGLMFALEFQFRKWTSGAAADSLAARAPFYISGETMPRDGRPCSKQVALFVRAALKEKIKPDLYSDLGNDTKGPLIVADKIKKLLLNHPGIGLVSWPKLGES